MSEIISEIRTDVWLIILGMGKREKEWLETQGHDESRGKNISPSAWVLCAVKSMCQRVKAPVLVEKTG